MKLIPYILITSLFFAIAAYIEKHALTNISINSFFLIREITMLILIFSVSFSNKSNIIQDYNKLNLSTFLTILVSPLLVFMGLYIMYYILQNSEKFNSNISIILALTYGLVLIFGLLIDLFMLKTKLLLINIMGIFVIIFGIGMCLHH